MVNEPGQHSHCKGSAAESEAVDSIARLIIPAQEGVDVDDVALQPPAERASQYGQRFEGGRPHAVVAERDLFLSGRDRSRA